MISDGHTQVGIPASETTTVGMVSLQAVMRRIIAVDSSAGAIIAVTSTK